MITTKLVPIYTENIKGRQNHTIFIDKQTNLTYKAYHKEPSQAIYWFGLFTVLAVLRGIQEVHSDFKPSCIPDNYKSNYTGDYFSKTILQKICL